MSVQERSREVRTNPIWNTLDSWTPTLNSSEQAAVYETMRHNAVANVDFYVLILLSSTIAYFGLLQNSGAVIIGAMLVAPLMSPMIAMAHSIVMGNPNMLWRAAVSTLVGIGLAIAVGTVFTLVLPFTPPKSEILARTAPNIFDLIIAVASGAAGAYAISRKEVAAAMPGVAIAAALVPPLCVVGYGLGSFDWAIAWGASFLFLTNLASILLTGAFVFMLLGFRPDRTEHSQRVRRYVMIAAISLMVIAIPLTAVTVEAYGEGWRLLTVRNTLTEIVAEEVAEIEDVEVRPYGDGYVANFTVYTYGHQNESTSTEAGIEDLQRVLSEAVRAPVALRIRAIPATLANFERTE
ncbi:TIGR00341 family protein [Chloroflexi bacterium TSY]|nr:TIGR00341 family protein [Chloroflexi bacterium TSY]